MAQPKEIRIRIPDWLVSLSPALAPTVNERMAFVVELARENVTQKTGGPFAAAVFERDSGQLVAAGVNLVTTEGLSVAHAEIVALMGAQRAIGDYHLGRPGRPALELVTSTAPCAMCLGAIPWSGVHGLVCGARDEDARAIGFDEGHKPADWRAHLESLGIALTEDVGREAAVAVLRAYRDAGGEIYNG